MAGRNVDFVNTIPGRCALSVNDPHSPAPPGWAWIKLTEIARLESGHTPSRNHPEYWDGDIAWIGIKDAREHHAGVINATLQHVTQAGIDNSAARLLPAKTVCLSRTASVGYVVVMGRPMATSQDFVNWVCTPALEPDYLKWLLLAEGEDGLRKFGKGSTHTTIYFPEVQAFHACVAPLNEQRRIVAKLDAIFEQTRAAKSRLERLPALLEKLKRSILAAAFRGDLTKDWRAANPNVEPASVLLDRIRAERRRRWEDGLRAKGKDPRKATYEEPTAAVEKLPILPEGWAWSSLGTVITSLDQGWSPKCETEPRTSPDEWAVMTTTAVQHNRFDEGANKRLPHALAPRADAELRVGDLLITRAGPRVRAGVCCRVDQVLPRLLACDKVYRFRVDESVVLGEYVELLLNSPRILDMLESMKTGISDSGVNLTQEKFTALMIPIAPIDEQQCLVRHAKDTMSGCAALLDRARSALANIGSLEQAAVSKAFRGELVPQDPTDEPASVLLDRIRAGRAAEPEKTRRGREVRREDVPAANPVATGASKAHTTNGHHDESLDLVVGMFQSDRRLTTTAITAATGLDSTAVKKALKILVDGGQVRVHGRARGTTYEWAT